MLVVCLLYVRMTCVLLWKWLFCWTKFYALFWFQMHFKTFTAFIYITYYPSSTTHTPRPTSYVCMNELSVYEYSILNILSFSLDGWLLQDTNLHNSKCSNWNTMKPESSFAISLSNDCNMSNERMNFFLFAKSLSILILVKNGKCGLCIVQSCMVILYM